MVEFDDDVAVYIRAVVDGWFFISQFALDGTDRAAVAEEGERVDILVVVIVVMIVVVIVIMVIIVVMIVVVVVIMVIIVVMIVIVVVVMVIVVVIMVMIIVVVDFEGDEAAVALECHIERLVCRADFGRIVSGRCRLDVFRLVELHVTTGFVENRFIHVFVVVVIVIIVMMIIVVIVVVVMVVVMMIIVVVVIMVMVTIQSFNE